MKRIALLIAFSLVIPTFGISQTCLPEGIVFNTQSEIDSFQINYPNCTQIEGDVIIGPLPVFADLTDIEDLSGLNVLNSIGGDLSIYGNPLVNLEGLNNLTSIGGSLNTAIYYDLGGMLKGVKGSYYLNNIGALNNLVYLGGNLKIWETALPDLSGLKGLTSVPGDLLIGHHVEWPTLKAEAGYNPNLKSLNGIENIAEVGGILQIMYNDSLTDISKLNENITIDTLVIIFNSQLSDCAVQTICNHLSSGNNYSWIDQNEMGCSSIEEVEEDCENLGFDENILEVSVLFYPNPATDKLNFFEKYRLSILTLNIYNQLGQKIIHLSEIGESIDISSLEQGIYIIELTSNEFKIRQKLIIKE